MTSFIGAPGPAATRGEKALYQRIKLAFDNEPGMYCYVEPAIGDDRPDLVLMDPRFGAVVFEIKDYTEPHLLAMSKNEPWVVLVDGVEKPCSNPFVQVYQYWRTMQHYFATKSFHQAVVLPSISSKSEWGRNIIANAPARVVLFFKEDMATKNTFETRFFASIPRDQQLTVDEFNLLRGNLVPTCRLPSTLQSRFRLDEPLLDKDKLQVLDAEQEKLACALGDGHRLFFGVAGSGKTIILVARARYLARKHPDWRILLVCFNKLLAGSLHRNLNPQDYKATVIIDNYHRLAKHVIKAAGPPYSIEYAEGERDTSNDKTRFFNELVPSLFARAVRETSPQKYDAILVDEAQDFEPAWYEPLLGLLNPATKSLLVTLDGLQGIYARKRFHWSDVGISARGRVVKLQKAYRNPAEIGKAAVRVLPKELTDLVGTADEFLDTREYARSGGVIDLIIVPDKRTIIDQVAEKTRQCIDKNWSVIISFRQNINKTATRHPIFDALLRFGIDPAYITSNTGNNQGTTALLLVTPQAAKGLEADAVIIPDADGYNTTIERQLLYVAMTRATRAVILVASQKTPLLDLLCPAPK
jgi:hypothetical protein